MDIKLMISIFPSLLSGAVITLQLLVSSMFFGLIIGLIFAILRINKNPIINKFAYGYSYFFRGTPLLVQLYLIYYGLANIEFLRNSFFWVIIKEPYWCAIKKGYIEADQSLGVTKKITFYRIQLPIAIKQSLPAYGNEIILMLKGTSLASVITIMDLMGEARKVNVLTFKPFEAFITAGIIYLFITFIIHNIIKYLEKKYGFQT